MNDKYVFPIDPLGVECLVKGPHEFACDSQVDPDLEYEYFCRRCLIFVDSDGRVRHDPRAAFIGRDLDEDKS